MSSKATFIKMATCIIFPPMITFGIACIFLRLLGSCITAGTGLAIMIDMSLFSMSGTIIPVLINLWLLAIRSRAWWKIFVLGFIAPASIVGLICLMLLLLLSRSGCKLIFF